MNDKVKWITRCGLGIALLILLQFVTKPLGQLVTGSCVNLILALSTLLYGPAVGAVIALVSPFMAYFLGINAQILVVPAIALGNLAYVLIIWLTARLLREKAEKLPETVRNITAVICGAAVKFALQYVLIVLWIAPSFLPEKARPVMAVNFGLIQLATACIGGVAACLICPVIRKAVKE